MNITIRTAFLKDLPRLVVINSLGSEEEGLIVEEKLPPFVKSGDLIVALADKELVGLLYWRKEFLGDNNWFLTQVTVDKDYRRKGTGEKLCRYFLEHAKNNGIKKVFADAEENNFASINLLKKLGGISLGKISLEGEKKNYYQFDLK
ncbi:MAG: GNAT family N-acetyltransferase [Patescibacteria group bacterium]